MRDGEIEIKKKPLIENAELLISDFECEIDHFHFSLDIYFKEEFKCIVVVGYCVEQNEIHNESISTILLMGPKTEFNSRLFRHRENI